MGMPTLSSLQDAAVHAFGDWYESIRYETHTIAPVFYLAGYAGTGKSTILPAMIDKINLLLDHCRFCAPTGKAAKVMTEKLHAFGLTNVTAMTIHRLIYRPRPLRVEVLDKLLRDRETERDNLLREETQGGSYQGLTEKIFELDRAITQIKADLEKAFDESERPKFQLNVDSDASKAKLLVIDEGSMVGETVANDLRSFGVPILVMGDPGQLPPVGEPPGLTNGDPDFFLSEIHRQAADSPIIRLATLVRQGHRLTPGKHGTEVTIVDRANDTATYDLARDAQILVGTNRKRWIITSRLRRSLGYKTSGPCAGEPLICCKNSKKVPSLVNGSFVKCLDDVGDLSKGDVSVTFNIEEEEGTTRSVDAYQGLFEEHLRQSKGYASAPKHLAFRSRVETEHFDWGWAITTHKAQGSQWPDVIVHDESGVFGDDAHRWLYTAITRAAHDLTVIL